MELHIFITCEEFITILNELVHQAGCGIFIANKVDEPYKLYSSLTVGQAVVSKNIELGFSLQEAVLLIRSVKDIYREDRVGFVSVHHICGRVSSGTLLETTFTSDPSNTAKIISKTLRKILDRNMAIHKGVKVSNDKTGSNSINKSIYWSDGALACGKVWRQAENSFVRFEPA